MEEIDEKVLLPDVQKRQCWFSHEKEDQETYKTRGVVISHSLSIAKGFQ